VRITYSNLFNQSSSIGTQVGVWESKKVAFQLRLSFFPSWTAFYPSTAISPAVGTTRWTEARIDFNGKRLCTDHVYISNLNRAAALCITYLSRLSDREVYRPWDSECVCDLRIICLPDSAHSTILPSYPLYLLLDLKLEQAVT